MRVIACRRSNCIACERAGIGSGITIQMHRPFFGNGSAAIANDRTTAHVEAAFPVDLNKSTPAVIMIAGNHAVREIGRFTFFGADEHAALRCRTVGDCHARQVHIAHEHRFIIVAETVATGSTTVYFCEN